MDGLGGHWPDSDKAPPADPRALSDDEMWEREGDWWSWELPAAAHWTLRLPVIRFIRAALAAYAIESHAEFYGALGKPRSGYDAWVIYAIRRGWC